MYDCSWRLHPNSAQLARAYLFAMGIPSPDLPVYRDYSDKFAQSQGGLTRQGYKNVTLLWDDLSVIQFKTLTDLVEAGITAGVIFATIQRNDGTGLQDDWIDISGLPQPLDYQVLPRGEGIMYSNVSLTINAITITSDPSSII